MLITSRRCHLLPPLLRETIRVTGAGYKTPQGASGYGNLEEFFGAQSHVGRGDLGPIAARSRSLQGLEEKKNRQSEQVLGIQYS